MGGKLGKDRNVINYRISADFQSQSNLNIENPTNTLQQSGLADSLSLIAEDVILPSSSNNLGVNAQFRNWQFGYQFMQRKANSSIGQNPFIWSSKRFVRWLDEAPTLLLFEDLFTNHS